MSSRIKKAPVTQKHGNYKKTTDAVIAMANGGLTTSEIAKETETTPSNISQILKRYKISTNQLDGFVTHRIPIFQGLQDRIVKSINSIDLKKAGLYQKVLASSILLDKEQLISGKSTSNVALHLVVERLEREDRENRGANKPIDNTTSERVD